MIHWRLHGQHAFQVLVHGQPVAGVLHAPRGWQELPCVVLCHGLLSSMESPKFRQLAEALQHERIGAVRFDFRGCGSSHGRIEDSTVSGRVEDLRELIGFLKGTLGHRGPLGLMGSSMGGFVALLCAATGAEVSALSVWATPFEPAELAGPAIDSQTGKLGPAFLEDLRNHDLSSLGKRIHHLLVIHGENDELVPVSHALRIHELACAPKKLHLIPGADHRFTHPAHRQEATRLTLRWFREYLALESSPRAGRFQP